MPKLLRDARGSGFIDTEAIEAMSHGAPATIATSSARTPSQRGARKSRADDHHPDAVRHARAGGAQRADRDRARLRRHGRDPGHPGAAYAAQSGAGDVRRRVELPAAGDPAVHPVRRDHERLVDLAAADRVCDRVGRLHPRRPVDGGDRHLGILRGNLRLGGRRRRRARHHSHSGDEEPRLFQGSRGRDHVVGGEPCHHHPALDPDGAVRGDGADLGGQAVRRRHHSRPDRRLGDGRRRLLPRGQIRFSARAGVPAVRGLAHLQGGVVGLHPADRHPRQHFRRHRHRHRRRRHGGGGRGRRRRPDLPRSRFPRIEKSLHRRRHPDRGGDAAGRGLRADRHLPDRSAAAAGARPRHHARSPTTNTSCCCCSTSPS